MSEESMPILTDGVHLGCRSLAKLHRFARVLDFESDWFQKWSCGKFRPHYDITGKKTKLRAALKAGAVMVSRSDFVRGMGWK